MAQSSSIEQQKILRIFKLINLLQGNLGKPVHRFAELLGTDARTIYRYFNLLEELGFDIVKEHSKYKIREKVGLEHSMNFGAFSQEESRFLKQLIEAHSDSNLLRDSLIQKLGVRSELKIGTEQLFKANLGRIVDEIGKGIQSKKMIWLKDYYSLSSDSVSDRLVEPVNFTLNYDGIHCFEVESKSMKLFKIERIGEVVVSTNPWKNESKHVLTDKRLFGFTGKNRFTVKLKLSKKAHQLMLEEYPTSRPFMYVKNRNQYYFKGEIPQLPGLARFILSLPGEVKIEEGEELRAYLADQIERFSL